MSTCISSSGCLLSFCSLGRGGEGREAGGEVLSVPPTMLPAPWLNFHWPWAAPTQLGEPPGPVPGRQADAAGWLAHAHCREAACPAEMAIGRGWVLSLHSSPFPGLSPPTLTGQVGWALLAEWESPQQDWCPGPQANIIPLNSCL